MTEKYCADSSLSCPHRIITSGSYVICGFAKFSGNCVYQRPQSVTAISKCEHVYVQNGEQP